MYTYAITISIKLWPMNGAFVSLKGWFHFLWMKTFIVSFIYAYLLFNSKNIIILCLRLCRTFQNWQSVQACPTIFNNSCTWGFLMTGNLIDLFCSNSPIFLEALVASPELMLDDRRSKPLRESSLERRKLAYRKPLAGRNGDSSIDKAWKKCKMQPPHKPLSILFLERILTLE